MSKQTRQYAVTIDQPRLSIARDIPEDAYIYHALFEKSFSARLVLFFHASRFSSRTYLMFFVVDARADKRPLIVFFSDSIIHAKPVRSTSSVLPAADGCY